MPKKRAQAVRVHFSAELLEMLDAEVTRLKTISSKSRLSRAEAILALVQRNARNFQPGSTKDAHDRHTNEAAMLKLRAGTLRQEGKTALARQASLRAAAMELLALAVLEEPADPTVVRNLIEIVELIKEGTGFKSLPDTRRGARSLSSTTGSA